MDWLAPVWLITKRELRDQLRDWRIVFPLLVLTILFPMLMNEVAYQAVEFVAKYGETLLVDRLVPFSVLIIGFFPITISLVVALESFVGEKERGTIEPLLSTPLKDWHIYLGKLLVGILTPLLASFVSIGLYLIIVSRQKIEMPEVSVLFQLFALTAAHAVLMVSGAIVISAQSTSVKAANLLASFIIVPVAILMQGESALLFWGNNNQILWLAVAAVLLLAGLLIRLGLSHFQREYLLGREIDILNFRWIWQTFFGYFKGGARSLVDWYRIEILKNVRQLFLPLGVMLAVAVLVFWLSFQWTVSVVPGYIESATPENFKKLADEINGSPITLGLRQELSASYIFAHNVRAVGMILLAGLVSFSVLGILVYLLNLSLIGVVLGFFELMGYSALVVGASGLAPHGIFELPALLLASAAMLRVGVVLVTPQTGRSLGEVLLEALADWARIAVGLVLPLLLVAAIIETYVTPAILLSVL